MGVTEEWKKIEGVSGEYFVSNTGKVKCLGYYSTGWKSGRRFFVKCDRELKPSNNGNGYYSVRIRRESETKQSCFYIHRLVATAFIPNPENKPEVNHKNFNKLDNSVENLEWVTSKENKEHFANSEKSQKGKPKNSRPTNTGQKYICRMTRRGRTVYRVNVYNQTAMREFQSLEKAILYRDEVTKKLWKHTH